jgi:plastocyanin
MTTFADRTTTHRWLSSFCFALAAALAVVVATCKPSEVFGIRPGTVFVSVRDSFFTPDTIHVGRQLPVRWTNEGTVLHTVVSDSGFFGSGQLTPKAWYEVRFDSVGAFPYHCNIHAGMLGTVVVDP